ncbi:MAG: AtpZ/AtpI family protein [Ruminococcus flavefaciens]|nr:AtpZ/AtpI family protein [Ruminococcus flavefaciens]
MRHKNPFIDQSALEGDDTPVKSEYEMMLEQAERHTEVEVAESHMVTGIVIGVAAGITLGTIVFGDTGTGLGVGMLIGMAAGASVRKRPRNDGNEQNR